MISFIFKIILQFTYNMLSNTIEFRKYFTITISLEEKYPYF